MKKQNLAACFSVITIVFTIIGCKIESTSKTNYEEKLYVSAVKFEAESSPDDTAGYSVKITMSTATDGAVIYYSIDGTEPTAESTKYKEPLYFNKDTQLKAFAIKEGLKNSPISLATLSISSKTITKKVYICAKCKKEYNTAQEAADCCAEKTDTSIPSDVTELKAHPKDSAVILTWKDASDNDIFGYIVNWKVSDASRNLSALEKDSFIIANKKESCIITGLTNGKEYTFTVKTMDTSGNISKGATVNETLKSIPAGKVMEIELKAPNAKSNTTVTVTVNISTRAEKIEKVVYKKDGSENAAKLLSDAEAKEANQNSSDNKEWNFVLKATDESANGIYTVAVLDSDGREKTSQIEIKNFDFTPPEKIKNVTTNYSSESNVITLNWDTPIDSDFNHVKISYTTNDGLTDSERSEPINENTDSRTFTGIDKTKNYYTYYIKSVDSVGNESLEIKYKVRVNKTKSHVPEYFVKIPAVSIKGTESMKPSSEVFLTNRAMEIASFYMSDHPVTRAEYKEVIGRDPSTASAYDANGNILTGNATANNPVNYINWYDAIVYCNMLSLQEGLSPCYTINGFTNPDNWGNVPGSKNDIWNDVSCDWNANGYRLPSEAEWEWAARGGESYIYAGSNNIDEVAWYSVNTNYKGTREVKVKKANGYKLYDMSGNVKEWCWDWYGRISVNSAITGPLSGNVRCLRGGSWRNSTGTGVNVTGRDYRYPHNRSGEYGFRVVLNAN